MPSTVDMSFGMPMHSPASDSSAAVCRHTSACRAVMYVRTPRRTSPSAIIRPMPLLPPVTTATRPSRSNMSTRQAASASGAVRPWRSSTPGVLPVHSPSSKVTWPLTMVSR